MGFKTLTRRRGSRKPLPQEPPDGAYEYETDDGWVIGAKHGIRSHTSFACFAAVLCWGILFGFAFVFPIWVIAVFAIPGIFTAHRAVNSVFGRTEVRVVNGIGESFSGVGPLGRKHQFEPREVRSIRTHRILKYWSHHVGARPISMFQIEIGGPGKPIRIGYWLTPNRRRWVAAALRKRLINHGNDTR